jgi:Dolichyl-phosphate-mannose-protein mannosyltransferase
VFLVSATTVMCDVLMLCAWVWSIERWLSGMRAGRQSALLVSGLLVGAASLAKYNGACLVPLLAAYALLHPGSKRWSAAWMFVPIAILAVWEAWTSHLYGRGHLATTFAFTAHAPNIFTATIPERLVVGLGFTGACLAPVLFYALSLWSWRSLIIGATIALAAFVCLAIVRPTGIHGLQSADGLNWWAVPQLALWLAVGAGVLALAVMDLKRRRDRESILLLLWIAGVFVFVTLINWSVTARTILPMAPGVGILIVRRIEDIHGSWSPGRIRDFMQTAWPLLPAGALALAVAAADASLANAERRAAEVLADRYGRGPSRLWFLGHWGFQFYMANRGGIPVDRDNFSMAVGDIVVRPLNNVEVFKLPTTVAHVVDTVQIPSMPGIEVMEYRLGAGFYASVWGCLPFVFGPSRPEEFMVMMLDVPIRDTHAK